MIFLLLNQFINLIDDLFYYQVYKIFNIKKYFLLTKCFYDLMLNY